MIERDLYIRRVEPFVNKDLIKVFVGQRRVGKSMLLRLIAKQISKSERKANLIFIDKEDYEFDAIKTHSDLDQYIKSHKKPGMNYLFIDEVQEIEGFELILRSYNQKPDFDVYCTGSNARIFSSQLATYLSGRQIVFHIGSLNFNEFCRFHKLKANKDSLMKFIKFGGLPYLANLPDNDRVRYEYLKSIYATILLRDVISRNSVRDTRFLEDLLKFLADNTGNIFSANKIVKYLKLQQINKNVSLVLNYISYLKNAFLINAVKRYDIQGKKQFEVGEKYYFEDIGIRNAIIGFKISDIGNIIENLVYLHLKSVGYSVKIGYWGNKEIDFVAEKDNERIYIQVSYLLSDENTINREFGNLLQIKDNYPKYVVSFDDFQATNTYKGIIHFTLVDFLTKFNGSS